MSDYKLHTPNGVSDIMCDECDTKNMLESTISLSFKTHGYRAVETPMFEYYDCYIGRSGQISQENLYKFFDEQGRILVLRPDFTTSIARMCATKAASEPMPQRYMYNGSVFRAEQTEGVRRREFTQSGIELIGSYSPAADAEVIAAATEAILKAGIEEMTMEIGQVAFYTGLAHQIGVDEATAERLRGRIDSKDVVGIREILKGIDAAPEIKKLIEELPYLFGDISIIDRARTEGLNETSKKALDNLRDIYNILCDYGYEKYISLDLGMLQSIDYYTGSIFKCYTQGVGFPICAGGRYDNLMGNFGLPCGAVGAAIGINRLMTVYKPKIEMNTAAAKKLIFAEAGAGKQAKRISDYLRNNWAIVENYVGGGDFAAAKELGKAKGIAEVIRVFDDGNTEIHDLEGNTVERMTADELIDKNEQAVTDFLNGIVNGASDEASDDVLDWLMNAFSDEASD